MVGGCPAVCMYVCPGVQAVMMVAMLWTDSVHPPGGALVLMAVDSVAIQRMDWCATHAHMYTCRQAGRQARTAA